MVNKILSTLIFLGVPAFSAPIEQQSVAITQPNVSQTAYNSFLVAIPAGIFQGATPFPLLVTANGLVPMQMVAPFPAPMKQTEPTGQQPKMSLGANDKRKMGKNKGIDKGKASASSSSSSCAGSEFLMMTPSGGIVKMEQNGRFMMNDFLFILDEERKMDLIMGRENRVVLYAIYNDLLKVSIPNVWVTIFPFEESNGQIPIKDFQIVFSKDEYSETVINENSQLLLKLDDELERIEEELEVDGEEYEVSHHEIDELDSCFYLIRELCRYSFAFQDEEIVLQLCYKLERLESAVSNFADYLTDSLGENDYVKDTLIEGARDPINTLIAKLRCGKRVKPADLI